MIAGRARIPGQSGPWQTVPSFGGASRTFVGAAHRFIRGEGISSAAALPGVPNSSGKETQRAIKLTRQFEQENGSTRTIANDDLRMVKKKAGGSKKSKEPSGPSQEELAEKYQLPPLEFKSEAWVTLHVRCPASWV